MIIKFTHISLRTPTLFCCSVMYSHVFFYTCHRSQEWAILYVVSLFILFLWSFACFNISITVASTGHTNTTVGNSGCLEAHIQKFVEINPSTKTKYWYKINTIESGQKSMQKSGKS